MLSKKIRLFWGPGGYENSDERTLSLYNKIASEYFSIMFIIGFLYFFYRAIVHKEVTEFIPIAFLGAHVYKNIRLAIGGCLTKSTDALIGYGFDVFLMVQLVLLTYIRLERIPNRLFWNRTLIALLASVIYVIILWAIDKRWSKKNGIEG